MQIDQLLRKTSAACRPPVMAPRSGVARTLVALACSLGLLASLGGALEAKATTVSRQASASPAGALQSDSTSWTNFVPPGWVNAVPFASGVTATDPDGLNPATAAYRTSTDGGASWTAWTQIGLTATPATNSTVVIVVQALTFPDSQTNNRIQFHINSQLGVTQTSPEYTVPVDTVAPGSPLNMQSLPDAWTNVNSFAETWTNPVDTSGIAGAYYRIDSEPQSAHDGIFVPNPNQITGIVVPSEGAHSLLLWLIDHAGNVDHRTYRVDWQAFKYDATPPAVGITRQGPLGQNGWYTDTVTVTFAPADLPSGIAEWSWQLDGQPPSTATSTVVDADALHTLVLAAADNAGNAMQPVTTTVPVDAGRPAISHTLSLPPAASGWYTAPLTATLGLTDAVSGPGAITWRLDGGAQNVGALVRIEQDGPHTLTASGRDQAGNRSNTLSLSLPVDAHPPATTLALAPAAPGASGFYSSTVSGTWSASDVVTQPVPGPGSGVLATRMRIDAGAWQAAAPFSFSTTGIYRLQYASQDRAGNVELTRTRVISIDVTPPGAPIAPTILPDTWSSTNQFGLSWQNPVDTSGIVGVTIFLGQGPPAPGAGVFYPSTNQIDGLAAPGEGLWPVWMALRDAAGNNGAFVNVGNLRYDSTPPQVHSGLSGPAGLSGWFVGPVEATLTITDTGSGPASIQYRLNGGAWQQASSAQVAVPVTAAGKHVIDFLGQDRAGLASGPSMRTVRIDGDAPGLPVAAEVSPQAWVPTSTFTVTWRNPLDTSGVATATYSFDPPADPYDGQSVPAANQSAALDAPAEGAHDLYLWLRDTAGNVGQPVQLVEALRFDATAPAIQLQYAPLPNASGWFRSPVLVTLAVTDAHSGVARTTWQLDGQAPVAGAMFTVSGDGSHTVVAQSVDNAGNSSQQTEVIRIDTRAPSARLLTLGSYSASTQIQVKWEGADAAVVDGEQGEASGLVGFDLQVRQGNGPWQAWFTAGATQTQATYVGQRGQRLAFRVRANDVAGNSSAWMTAGGRNTVFIDPILNGAFSTLNWDGWDTVDGLQMAIVQEQELYPGLTVLAARLGSSLYQACAATGPNMLPTPLCGDTWSSVSQAIAVPTLDMLAEPTLEVWYRIRTYDQITTTSTIWSQLCPVNPPPPFRLVDSFDVSARAAGVAQADVLLRDGNRLPQFPLPIEQRDLGWKLATIDLSAYAGQTVTLDFSNHNRLDNRFNTWTELTNIKLRGSQRKVFMPLVPHDSGDTPADPPVCWPTGAGSGPAATPPEASFASPGADSAEGYLR